MFTPNVPLVFVDTETTGLKPGKRAVWEVAMIRREVDGTTRQKVFQVELTNREIGMADPQALSISGYHERYDPVEAFSKRTAAALIQEFTRGAHVVGMVPNFDTEGFQSILDYMDEDSGWYYQLFDIDIFAAGVLATLGFQISLPVNTQYVCSVLGVSEPEFEDRHTALGDTKWVVEMYDAAVTMANNGVTFKAGPVPTK